MAWANIAVPAWTMIWWRVKDTISLAMSRSRMRDSDACRFSEVTFRLVIVCSRRFCDAPSDARRLLMMAMASRTSSMAAEAPVVRSMPLRSADVAPSDIAAEDRSCVVTPMVSALEAPTWKVTDADEKTLMPANLVDVPMLSICLSSSLASASSALPSLVAVVGFFLGGLMGTFFLLPAVLR